MKLFLAKILLLLVLIIILGCANQGSKLYLTEDLKNLVQDKSKLSVIVYERLNISYEKYYSKTLHRRLCDYP